MGSPAVGALLFSLKKYDTEDDKRNNDRGYDELLSECRGNVIVCGSSVGGTGAFVITLARRLFEEHGQKAKKVMPLLIHKWFEFSTSDQSSENRKHAKERNEKMDENAASVLAYVGEELARNFPAALVGVPDSKLEARTYTGDHRQAHKNSYIHVIGALAGMQHLLSDETEVSPDLYGLLASDPSRLTGDIQLSEWLHSTLKDLVGQAQYLTYLLKIYQEALREYENRQYRGLRKWINYINWGSFNPLKLVICDWVYKAVNENDSKLGAVARQLKVIQNTYDDLLKWPRDLEIDYDISETEKRFLDTEQNHLGGTRKKSLPSPNSLEDKRKNLEVDAGIMVGKEEYIALALFHWVADWVKDWWKAGKPSTKIHHAQGVYWPDPVKGKEAIEKYRIAGRTPGRLFKVPRNSTGRILRDYYNVSDTSPDGWPHPIAVTSHYKFLIEQKDQVSIRKLEMLLVGHALGILELKRADETVGHFTLVEKEYPGLLQYLLAHRRNGKIYGFNSPETILCYTPDTNDKDWAALWEEINDYVPYVSVGKDIIVVKDWQKSENWEYRGEKARRCIATWINHLGGEIKTNNCWKILAKQFEEDTAPCTFGIFGVMLPLSDGGHSIQISLPVIDN